jgi:tetratricopeptide (TPR) repeat protein
MRWFTKLFLVLVSVGVAIVAEHPAAATAEGGAALAELLQKVLLPGTAEHVSEKLAELGVHSIGDLQWATDDELMAIEGVKAVQLRKLRHVTAAPASDEQRPEAVPTVTTHDAEAELLCLRSGKTDCATQEAQSLPQEPVERVAGPSPAPAPRQDERWDDADESDLKSLLVSLSMSVEQVRGDTGAEPSAEAPLPPIPPSSPPLTPPPSPLPPSPPALVRPPTPTLLVEHDVTTGKAIDCAAVERAHHLSQEDVAETKTVSFPMNYVHSPGAPPDEPIDETKQCSLDGSDGIEAALPPAATTVDRSVLHDSIDAAMKAARYGSTEVPPSNQIVTTSRRERLAFAAVREASVLSQNGRYRAALYLQQDALLIDDSAAAAHYNNIGVTHAKLNEMVHAADAFERALDAAAGGMAVWSEVRSGATQVIIKLNKARMDKFFDTAPKDRKPITGDGFFYIQEQPTLWLSSSAPTRFLAGNDGSFTDSRLSFASLDFGTAAAQSAEIFLHRPTAKAAAAAAAQQEARQRERPSKYAANQPSKSKSKSKKKKQKKDKRKQNQARSKEQKQKELQRARQHVARRSDLWPMDFLHTYLLGDRPVVVTDAAPSPAEQAAMRQVALDAQALSDDQALFEYATTTAAGGGGPLEGAGGAAAAAAAGTTTSTHSDDDGGTAVSPLAATAAAAAAAAEANSPTTHNGGLMESELSVPYFIDTDAAVVGGGSNPRLFVDNTSTFILEEGTPRRHVACGAEFLLILPDPAVSVGAIDAVLRPPPTSALSCLQSTRSPSAGAPTSMEDRLAWMASASSAGDGGGGGDNDDAAAIRAREAAAAGAGRWIAGSCIHIDKAMWADSDAPHQSDCPEDDEIEPASAPSSGGGGGGGGGSSSVIRQTWEVPSGGFGSGEVLFVPEGWEISLLQPVGAEGAAGHRLAVATVPFGWEDTRRGCC